MATNSDRDLNLPAWIVFDELLKFANNIRPQHFDIVNKYDNLRRPTIITMHRKVAVCLVGQVVRPPKTLQEILDAFIKLSKNASLLAVASHFCF